MTPAPSTGQGLPKWYVWLAVVLAPILASVTVLGIALQRSSEATARAVAQERQAREASEQAFCGIVTLLDDAWRATAPTTESGIRLAAAVREAREEYGCPAS